MPRGADPLAQPAFRSFRCITFARLGVELVFTYADGQIHGEFIADERLEGHEGVMNGGFMASMMDEVLGDAVLALGQNVVTGRLELRYRRPARLGIPLTVRGWIEEARSRAYRVRGVVEDPEGVVLQAEGLMMPIDKPIDAPTDWYAS